MLDPLSVGAKRMLSAPVRCRCRVRACSPWRQPFQQWMPMVVGKGEVNSLASDPVREMRWTGVAESQRTCTGHGCW